MPHNPVTRFALLVLLGLPAMLFAWYCSADYLTRPLTFLLNTAAGLLWPEIFSAFEQSGFTLEVVTRFAPPQRTMTPAGQTGVLTFSINPLIYSYNLPLFAALVVATKEAWSEKLSNLMIGAGVLIVAQCWGVLFDALKTILFNLGPEIGARAGFSPLQMDAVALAYQLGYLIVPPILPILLWALLHPRSVAGLAPGVVERLS